MTIAQDEESLFTRWRVTRADFIADGVVDEAAYSASNPRVAFLMKEANDTSGAGRWDLRGYVRSNGKGRTLDNIARWTYGFRNGNADVPWQRVKALGTDERATLLQSIAIVNLKKSPGKYEAVELAIYAAATTDRELLREQMAIYDPDVTVWCGTDGSSLLVEPPKWQETQRGIAYCFRTLGKVVIRYAHPSARVADALLFYGLFDAVQEIRTVA